MSLKSKNPTNTIAWKKLKTHFEAIKNEHMSDWFKTNSKRAIEMSLQWDDFFLDFSKNRINSETLSLLQDLADEIDLSDACLLMEIKLIKPKIELYYILHLGLLKMLKFYMKV